MDLTDKEAKEIQQYGADLLTKICVDWEYDTKTICLVISSLIASLGFRVENTKHKG